MTYEEALAYMEGLRRHGVKLGIERFAALLERLGGPHLRYPVAHVAGTKGKGSTTAMIAAIVHEHGHSVGGYFSPYVYDVRERVQVDGEMIAPSDFADLVTRIAPHIAAVASAGGGSTTEFELKTAVGFLHFAERPVDAAAIEVGIGGRLDATNVVRPAVAVITNIGLDHIHILGDTHAKIAAEKAGIVKPGVLTITAADEPSALAVIESAAAERRAPLMRVAAGPACAGDADVVHWEAAGEGLAVHTPRGGYRDLHPRLAGRCQFANAACAVAASEALLDALSTPVSEEAVRRGLARAYLPGRIEIIRRKPTVLLDGAHNELAARALAAEVSAIEHRRLHLVIGMVAGHGPEGVVDALAPLATRVLATRPTWVRGQPAERIAEAALRHCADVRIVTPPLDAALEALDGAAPDDLVVVTGSFYTVGDVPPRLLLAGRVPATPR